MAMELKLTGLKGFVGEEEISQMTPLVQAAQDVLHAGSGAGNDFLGWVDLPEAYDKEEFARIKQAAKKIQQTCEVLVVIGIGGSYLGARAAIEFVNGQMYNGVRPEGIPEVYFVGNNISSSYLNDIVKIIGNRDFGINVISKSGTTTEPAIAFRIFKELLEKKYGKAGAQGRIYATTDRARGALKALATQEGYETFVVPDNVGGRYSVLTAVGLLPIAAAGIDIEALMRGAAQEREAILREGLNSAAVQYAMSRQGLYDEGKHVEILAAYEPAFRFFAEWWKQLFGESEGKSGKGVFPASVDLTPDLHSMGQYMQQGLRMLQETVVFFDQARARVEIPTDADNLDGLNYLAGKTMDYVNEVAMKATKKAHIDGGVPVTEIRVERICEETVGALIYFFEFACGVSGYISGVNPFNQPGVEAYKTNMFEMLGKPGYEKK